MNADPHLTHDGDSLDTQASTDPQDLVRGAGQGRVGENLQRFVQRGAPVYIDCGDLSGEADERDRRLSRTERLRWHS